MNYFLLSFVLKLLESVCHVDVNSKSLQIMVRSVNTCMWMLTLTPTAVRGTVAPEMFQLFGTIEST